MVEAVMLWNEPNNLSHWDFNIDPDWKLFSEMTIAAARAIRAINPDLKIVLGGMSPVDPKFVQLLAGYGVMDHVDVVAIHGFPLDWNHWSIHDWPQKVEEIRRVAHRPVWVSEAGASSFGAEEVQVSSTCRLAGRRPPATKKQKAALITGTTTWDWCGKMAAPSQRLHVSHKAWEFASGFTMRILG
jgi:beta-xylosidase